MRRGYFNSQSGSLNVLLVPLILSCLLFVSALGFGAWAYMEMQDYKLHTDQKVFQAVEVAKKETESQKDNEFIEKEKEPLIQYKGTADLGGIDFLYPKTWSGYVKSEEGESEYIFHPNVVVGSENGVYALRVTVQSQPYREAVQEFDSAIQEGKAKAVVYKLPKMKDVTGIRINGEIEEGKQGSVIIMPLRDKSIKISTESKDFVGDFDKIILKNFSYNP